VSVTRRSPARSVSQTASHSMSLLSMFCTQMLVGSRRSPHRWRVSHSAPCLRRVRATCQHRWTAIWHSQRSMGTGLSSILSTVRRRPSHDV
jgi:hypothetical protein